MGNTIELSDESKTIEVSTQGPQGPQGESVPTEAVIFSAKVNEVAGVSNGDVVYISGATGGFPQISKADNTDFSKADVLAMVTEDRANGQTVSCTLTGLVENIDTSSFSEGDILYLATSGGITSIHPTGIDAVQRLGHAVKINANSGSILLDLDGLTVINEHNGTVRHQLVNRDSGSLAGAAYTLVNDAGHKASVSITSSGSSLPFPVGDGVESMTVYSEGYGDTYFTVDGNKGYYWLTDTGDTHDFSATEKMHLSASGKLSINGDLVINPAASQTPANIGELTFEATSDTSLTIKYKGSDGIVRSNVLTLS